MAWEPASYCTSKTGARNVWIDYIFYSSKTMDVESAAIEKCPPGPIPDENHPSDHLPVRAAIRFRSDTVRGTTSVRHETSATATTVGATLATEVRYFATHQRGKNENSAYEL
eukprot:TRINITY_DN19132_c1_g2_i1.p1 TRINITY_DN19132_c1_g2~~TRINITY_DN19132_c1_g2_i1.p1  ORF type:complete len:125 (-),score=10.77 TRINITY_DN19132_c1_g2_i1:336-671(-)